jgi:murein L,D-transpeptidase YafK
MGALESAKFALKEAEKSGALRYAEPQYRFAEGMIKFGWMEMARQNGRLAPFRNYHAADSILAQALEGARQAAQVAQGAIRALDSLARSDREDLRNELMTWREALDGSLENFKAERYWSAAELALQTSDGLISQQEYEAARQAVATGKTALQQLENSVAEYANDQAQKIGVWRRWVQEALDDSRARGAYAVIIDKSAHKTYLIKDGALVRSYECELGYNSARQKLFAGDGATPEGQYHVTRIKSNGNSKYHKALLINYPNAVDLRRFKENKGRGIISSHARIGALIEIHGEGGKNKDWTEGCVALTNGSIDHLLQFVAEGTPVTIVRKSDQWP